MLQQINGMRGHDIIAHCFGSECRLLLAGLRLFSIARVDDDHSVKIKCPPVHCLSGSSCSSPPRTRRFRFFCNNWLLARSWRHSVLIRKRRTLSFSLSRRLDDSIRSFVGSWPTKKMMEPYDKIHESSGSAVASTRAISIKESH